MAITLVQTRGNSGFTASLALGRTTTQGNLLVVAVTHQAATSVTITDNGGNTWVEVANAGQLVPNSDRRNSIWACVNANSVTTITASTSGTSALIGWMSEWAGTGSIRGGNATASPFNGTRQITVAAKAGDLVVGGIGGYNAALTPSAGWTGFGNQNISTTNHNVAWQIAAADGNLGPTWSGSNDAIGLCVAAFAPETSPEAGFDLSAVVTVDTHGSRRSTINLETRAAASVDAEARIDTATTVGLSASAVVDTDTARASTAGVDTTGAVTVDAEVRRASKIGGDPATVTTLRVETEAPHTDKPTAGFDFTAVTNVDTTVTRESVTEAALTSTTQVDTAIERASAIETSFDTVATTQIEAERRSTIETDLTTRTGITVDAARGSVTEVELVDTATVHVETETEHQGLQVATAHATTTLQVGFTANRPRPLNLDRLFHVPTETRFHTVTDRRYMTVDAETRFHTVQPG